MQKLLLRTAILLQLNASYPIAMPLKTILCGLNIASFNLDEDCLEKNLYYLSEKDFVLIKEDEISVGLKRYSLTLKGIEYLERRGF